MPRRPKTAVISGNTAIRGSRYPAAMQATYWAVYAGLGTARSVRQLHELLTEAGLVVSVKTLERYSLQYDWVARARAFDQERADAGAAAAVRDSLAQDLQHGQLGRAMQQVAVTGIQNFLRLTPAQQGAAMSVSEMARIGEAGVKIERLASGRVTEITEVMLSLKSVITTSIGDGFLEALDVMGAAMTERGFAEEQIAELRSEMARVYGVRADRLLDEQFKRVGIVETVFADAAPE